MAWSVTDWTTKPIWQYATLVNEFASAISERRSARDGGGAFTVISAGDIIQPFFHLFKYILWTMQMEIEDLITDWLGGGNLGFVKSHAGGGRPFRFMLPWPRPLRQQDLTTPTGGDTRLTRTTGAWLLMVR